MLRPPSTGTFSLTSGPLQISDSLTITGPGADKLAISGGNQAFNVINIDDGQASLLDVNISGLTVRNGGDGTTFINGAGIFSRENLTLDGVALLNNNAGLWLQVEAINLRMPGGVGGASV